MRNSRPWCDHLGLKPLPRSQRSLTNCIHCCAKLIIPRASFSRASPVTKRHTSLWYCKNYTISLYKDTKPPHNSTLPLCLWLFDSNIPSKASPGYEVDPHLHHLSYQVKKSVVLNQVLVVWISMVDKPGKHGAVVAYSVALSWPQSL
jgi:hypothetical protein